MARTNFFSFTVESKYPFPMDMLRYDECWPADSETANTMEASLTDQGRSEKRSYKLFTRKMFGPTTERWASFMFTVTEIEEHR